MVLGFAEWWSARKPSASPYWGVVPLWFGEGGGVRADAVPRKVRHSVIPPSTQDKANRLPEAAPMDEWRDLGQSPVPRYS